MALRRRILQLHDQGASLRSIARGLRISLCAVQHWIKRRGCRSIDQVDLQDLSRAPRRQARHLPQQVEEAVCHLRRALAEHSDLGFLGPKALREAFLDQYPQLHPPSLRSITRILRRRGLLDQKARLRRKAPPTAWWLSASPCFHDLDACDGIEDLPIEGLGLFHVLTAKSLFSPQVAAWVTPSLSAAFTLQCLRAHWQAHGLPAFALFDNDTRFQGPHCRPNTLGQVIRFCLQHGVTPVFAPPHETGFQADIESFNGLWQKKVFRRFHHADSAALQVCSDKFCLAYTKLRAARMDAAPARRPWPTHSPSHPLREGKIIFLRRTSESGAVRVLEKSYPVDPTWVHRLVRVELSLRTDTLSFYRLRRKEPTSQPMLGQLPLQGTIRKD